MTHNDPSDSSLTLTKSKTSFLQSPPAACVALRNTHVLIGTYTLDEKTATRSGSLILHKLAKNAHGVIELKLVQAIILPDHLGAVLDIRHVIAPHHQSRNSRRRQQQNTTNSNSSLETASSFLSGDLIAIATSTGHVLFYQTIVVLSNGNNNGSSSSSSNSDQTNHADKDDNDDDVIEIIQHSIHSVFDDWILVLSIMFHPVIYGVLVCTLSSGEVVVLRMEQQQQQRCSDISNDIQSRGEDRTAGEKIHKECFNLVEIDRHEDVHTGLEVWTSGFSLDGDVLYTGGDDGAFCRFMFGKNDEDQDENQDQDQNQNVGRDKVEGGDENEKWSEKKIERHDTYKAVAQTRDRKTHTAGVTAILAVLLPVSNIEVVLSGSYDCRLRIYNPTTKKFLEAELNLDGGVWRLEVLQFEEGKNDNDGNKQERLLILASCMHAGCRIIEVVEQEDGQVLMNVVGRMEEHESMNYASAAMRDGENGKGEAGRGWTIVSTSFYDKRLCVWRFEDCV